MGISYLAMGWFELEGISLTQHGAVFFDMGRPVVR